MRLPARLLRRKPDSHKGNYGSILVLAGSAEFSGAARLCAEAALRSGAGMVTVGIPKSINTAFLKRKAKEIMTLLLPETREGTLSLKALKKITGFLKKTDILIIGPGLGRNKATDTLIKKIIGVSRLPAVIDADALNALSNHLEILRNAQGERILTPHLREMSRLSGIKIECLKKDRKNIAKKFARHYNSTILLKGNHTLVTDGNKNFYVNRTGNPGMATAGSGDVLSGIAGAFLGQGLNAFEAAKYAAYIHGLAGDIAALKKTQLGMIASDIIESIPAAIKKSI
jgi:NAD(P)H-hydrate epimerase